MSGVRVYQEEVCLGGGFGVMKYRNNKCENLKNSSFKLLLNFLITAELIFTGRFLNYLSRIHDFSRNFCLKKIK